MSSPWLALCVKTIRSSTVGADLAELFVYPGDRHLFTDSSLPSYDATATALVVERSRDFLGRVG